MIRRLAALVLTAVPLALLPAAPAAAGGGCHAGVTTGSDPTVVMADACFTSTITFVDPGAKVTFVNEDPMIHNVTANRWGHFDDLDEGERFSVMFEDEGVYPFACTYHPGMTGAIVVGDADGAGNGTVVEATPTGPTAEAPATLEDASPVGTTDDGSSNAWPWLAGGAIGVAVGFGVASALVRRRAASPGGASAT
jgi:plastocyanin